MSEVGLWIILTLSVLSMPIGAWLAFWRDRWWGAALYFGGALVAGITAGFVVAP